MPRINIQCPHCGGNIELSVEGKPKAKTGRKRKVKDEDISAIRYMHRYRTTAEVCRVFKVSVNTVRDIVNKRGAYTQ